MQKNKKIKWVDPKTLLSIHHLDIVAKILYLKNKGNSFYERLYLENIRAFNNFDEKDGYKDSPQKFLDIFSEIEDNIKNNGFDSNKSVIKLSKNGIPIEGSHRIAVSIVYNKKVAVIDTNEKDHVYDYDFFLKKGMDKDYLDYLLLEYSKLKKDTFVAIVWGSAKGKDLELKEIFNSNGNFLLHYRKVFLSELGKKNLIIKSYIDQDWIGNIKNNFIGHLNKMKPCFNNSNSVRIYVFEAKDLKSVLNDKKKIRELFGIENHSVHITDEFNQSLDLLETFLNKNSMHHLNNSDIKFYKNFFNLYKKYDDAINNDVCYCLDSSTIMGLYGIREPGDIDYLHYGEKDLLRNKFEKIESNNSYVGKYHLKKIEEYIFDPKNYFYYYGNKCLSISNLIKYKNKRKSKEDLNDVKMINNFFLKTKNVSFYINNNYLKLVRNLKIYHYKFLFFVANNIIPEKIRPFCKKVYYKFFK